MPEQKDYYGEWVAALGGQAPATPSATAPVAAEKKDKDYYAAWSAALPKEPVAAPKNPMRIVEGSSFLQRLMKMSPDPVMSAVGGAYLPEPEGMPSAGQVLEGVRSGAKGFLDQSGINRLNPDPRYRLKPQYKSVVEGVAAGSTPENIKYDKGIPPILALGQGPMADVARQEYLSPVSEGVAGFATFVPELLVEFATDPGKTIRERPLDLLMVAEGFAGPKIRARITNAKAGFAKGQLSTAELGDIFKEIGKEAPKWDAPPEVKASFQNLEQGFGDVLGEGGAVLGQRGKPPMSFPRPQPPGPTVTPMPEGAEMGGELIGRNLPTGIPPEVAAPFEKAKSSGESVVGYTPRKTPGLGVIMVDNSGKQITMTEFIAKKSGRNIQAAEDLSVALMGAKKGGEAPPPLPTTPTIPLTPEQLAQNQLLGAVKGAKRLGPEQAALITKQRGQRMGQFEQTSGGLSGETKANARFSAQAGVMKHAEWEGIRDKFTPQAVDGYFEMIDRHPNLSSFEKMATDDALLDLLDGRLPQPAGIDKLSVVFGKDLADLLVAKRDKMTAGMRFLYEAGNMPRSLMASFDFSAPFRQGIFMVSHPKMFGAAFKEMPGFWKDPAKFEAFQREIIQRPTYLLMKKSGLGLTDVQRFIKGREEVFASSWAEKVPGVKASERAYVGFLNKLRADTFDYLVKMADKKGMKPYEDLVVSKKIAGLVNNATGRGSLPAGLERSALALNSLFFSPRLMASRINLLNPATYIKLPKHIRGWAIKTALADLGIAATVLGAAHQFGAEVNMDFASPDFLKIKVGDTRIDVMGGFSQYYRVLAQSGNFLYKNYITKEKLNYNALDRLGRFVSYKEAPVVTFGTDVLRGKSIMGDKFNLPSEMVQRLVPMMAQDIYDVAKDDPSLAQLLMTGTGVFGVGVQTYEDKKKKVKTY